MEIKLKLKIRDVEIELSMDEITQLKEILEKLTPQRVIEYRDNWWFYYPIYQQPWYNDKWIVTCDNTNVEKGITFTCALANVS